MLYKETHGGTGSREFFVRIAGVKVNVLPSAEGYDKLRSHLLL
jgi:hypothetical protein